MYFMTFSDLCDALAPLHLGNPAWIADLHDCWLKGAPSPDSIVRNPHHNDPRNAEQQERFGNVEKRLVLPKLVASWICAVSTLRGFPYSEEQALAMLDGKERFNW